MRLALHQFSAVARLTAVETLRQPIGLLLATTAWAMLALVPLVTSHTLGEGQKMVGDAALALHFVFGLLLGGFAACRSISGEIRTGTAATVLSKPVGREVFFLAKFAGVALVMAAFSVGTTAATLLALRTVAEPFRFDLWGSVPLGAAIVFAYAAGGFVNYFTRRPFASGTAVLLFAAVLVALAISGFAGGGDGRPVFGAAFLPGAAPVSLLVGAAVLVLTAMALALATRLDVVPTVSVLSGVLVLGLMSDYLFGRRAADAAWARVLHAVVPNWQHLWLADTLHLGQPVPAAYLLRAASYAALYLLAVLASGIVSFRHTEVKA